MTTSGVSHFTSTQPTTVGFNASRYTTTPPVVNQSGANYLGFLAFLSSDVLNSTLGSNYNSGPPQTNLDGPGVRYNATEEYFSPGAYVGITLTQYNTSTYAYSLYNATYNQINLMSHNPSGGEPYSSGTYLKASYVVVNLTASSTRPNFQAYQAVALYSNYMISITADGNNSALNVPRVTGLMQEEIRLMSGNA